jgi:hypothetical protein
MDLPRFFWLNDDCAAHPNSSKPNTDDRARIIFGWRRRSNVMTTVTTRIGKVMANNQRRQEHFAQTTFGIIAPDQDTEKVLIEKYRHEERSREIEEAWKGHLSILQRYVCDLLLENQQLRMKLVAANEPERRQENAGNL